MDESIYFDFGQPMPAEDEPAGIEEEGVEPENFFTYIPSHKNIDELGAAIKRFYNALPTGMGDGRVALCAVLLRAMLTEEAAE